MSVQIANLSFHYKKAAVDTLKNVDLVMAAGEIVAILGPSGCGKSTLLRLIAGLEEPNSGSISIAGKVVVDEQQFMAPEKRGVGMVFQDYALFPHMTVAENIGFGLKKLHGQERKQRIAEVIELVNLQNLAGRYPHELSGGQQQRVALARALAPKPAVLLLDEPFSNLDVDLRARLREELRRILKQTGITSVLVTHDREDAEAIADRSVFLVNQ